MAWVRKQRLCWHGKGREAPSQGLPEGNILLLPGVWLPAAAKLLMQVLLFISASPQSGWCGRWRWLDGDQEWGWGLSSSLSVNAVKCSLVSFPPQYASSYGTLVKVGPQIAIFVTSGIKRLSQWPDGSKKACMQLDMEGIRSQGHQVVTVTESRLYH